MPNVSIIIVCMNNLKNLYPCLNSIKKYTSVSFETFVVAYLFSKENLEKVKKDFQWVNFIESNKIRGFSENNNLALKQAKGKYCFIVNDDTEMTMPVIDFLVESFNHCPSDTAVISPVLIDKDKNVQVCGRPYWGIKEYILSFFSLWNEHKNGGKYVNQSGLFKTYNIIGACFLIKTDIFKEIGFFDEYYFFCPEDLAVSTLLNSKNYSCYVNSDVKIIHYEGGTSKISKLKIATAPAGAKGSIKFFTKGSMIKYCLIAPIIVGGYLLKYLKAKVHTKEKYDDDYIRCKAYINAINAILSKKTPKELFSKHYKDLTNN